MRGQRGPGDLARPGHDVDYPVGNADFAGEPGQVDRRQRRVLGRLDDHGVARRQRRRDSPADEQKREVPRKDESARSPGEPHRPGLVPGDRPGGPAGGVERHLREVPHRLDEVLHVGRGLGEHLAGVEGFDLGDDRCFRFHGVGQAVQQHSPIGRRHGRPAGTRESDCRGADGPINVLRLHRVERGQDSPGARVARFERFAAGGACVFAADDCRQRRSREECGNFIQHVEGDRGHKGSPVGLAPPTFAGSVKRSEPHQNKWIVHGGARCA